MKQDIEQGMNIDDDKRPSFSRIVAIYSIAFFLVGLVLDLLMGDFNNKGTPFQEIGIRLIESLFFGFFMTLWVIYGEPRLIEWLEGRKKH